MDLDNTQQEKSEGSKASKILGDLYFSEGQYEAAIEQYVWAVELNPEYLEAWNKMYVSLLQLGRAEDAEIINSKIHALKDKTKPIQERPITDGISSKNGTQQKYHDRPFSETFFKKNKWKKILSVIGIILLVGVLAAFLVGTGGQTPVQTPAQQRETILDTSMFVSGWWTYNISGGYTYEIQLTSDKPVTLYMCESLDDLQDGVEKCYGTVQRKITESTTSYHSTVVFPPEVNSILLITQKSDTNFQLKITGIS